LGDLLVTELVQLGDWVHAVRAVGGLLLSSLLWHRNSLLLAEDRTRDNDELAAASQSLQSISGH